MYCSCMAPEACFGTDMGKSVRAPWAAIIIHEFFHAEGNLDKEDSTLRRECRLGSTSAIVHSIELFQQASRVPYTCFDGLRGASTGCAARVSDTDLCPSLAVASVPMRDRSWNASVHSRAFVDVGSKK